MPTFRNLHLHGDQLHWHLPFRFAVFANNRADKFARWRDNHRDFPANKGRKLKRQCPNFYHRFAQVRQEGEKKGSPFIGARMKKVKGS